MLDSDVTAEHRVKVIGDVAGGVDTVDACGTVLIDDDTVVDPDPSAVQQVDDRLDTNADYGEIARDPQPRLGDDPRDAPVAFKRLHAVVEDGVDAVGSM